uniref:Uncharacterized protein n=1 Tax=Panagrolaimus sp. JU765 TaxID=591449 RepID=A0AC34QHF5_9BILA
MFSRMFIIFIAFALFVGLMAESVALQDEPKRASPVLSRYGRAVLSRYGKRAATVEEPETPSEEFVLCRYLFGNGAVQCLPYIIRQ